MFIKTRKRIIVFVLLLALLPIATIYAQSEDDMQPITLHFAATVGAEVAQCGLTYAGIGVDAVDISFNDFRLYVANIELLTADGAAVPLQLEQDGVWQVANVALLDFEDGSATCSEIGNAALNGDVIGMAPAGEYVGVRFDLGVPFELNHQEVTAAASPLNIAAMWWNWQGGYKFIRVDLMTHTDDVQPWNIHLGSTGCVSVAEVVPPQEACTRPNITTVTFDTFDFENGVIAVDLAGLLAGVPLLDNTPMPPGCMSGLDDPDCPALFVGLGLSLADGVCPDGDCSAQGLFRVSDMDTILPVGRTDMDGMMPMDSGSGGHSGHGG